MFKNLPFFPTQASIQATQIDAVYPIARNRPSFMSQRFIASGRSRGGD